MQDQEHRSRTGKTAILGFSLAAKLWTGAGHQVRLSSRHPETLKGLVDGLGPRASAGIPEEAARFGEVVVLTVPLKAMPELAPALGPLLAGKVVIDTCNASGRRDGALAIEASRHPDGSAGWAAAMFPGAKWVKAFNTVNFRALLSEAHRDGARVGIPIAGDDPAAVSIVEGLVRDAGFDPVPVGALRRGKEFEPGSRVYNTGISGPEVRAALGK